MKKTTLFRFAFLLMAAVSFTVFSCKKDVLPAIEDPSLNNNDLTSKATGSVSGYVTDENNLRVAGASVTAGVLSTTTDQYGYFSIKNAELVKNAAFVTVTKAGYFKGIKTWIVSDNNAAFFRIKLIPKTNAGTVSGTAGGTVTLTGGMKIVFPAAAFVNASNNTAYTGTVTVIAKWLDPTSADLMNTMPGDLRGKDASGNVKKLITYGMNAVELNGSAGELLQIAPNKKATLTMPIPASLQASAPATIPLWYFDESLGLWKEEGSAAKSGTEYSGDVSHFSFWNCDLPANYVQFNVTVNDAGGNPVQNALVKVIMASNGSYGAGYTNATGYAGGAIPANAAFTLEVYGNFGCSTVLYSQSFSSGTSNITLPSITLNSNRTVRIAGNITNCTNAAIANGKVLILFDNIPMIVDGNAAGQYSVSIPICVNTSLNTVITGFDPAGNTQSIPVSASYAGGSVNTVNLQLCNTVTTQEYINYSYSNNLSYAYTGPVDSVYIPQGNPGTYNYIFRGVKLLNLPSNPSVTLAASSSIAPVVGQTVTLGTFNDNSGAAGMNGSFTGTITYNEVGAVLIGYLGGTFTGTRMISGIPTAFSGSFRAKRSY